DDAIVWKVADVSAPDEGQHVVLAKADDADVAEHNQFVIAADFLEGLFEIGARVFVIAGEQLAIRLRHARGRLQETFAGGVVAGPFDQNADGGFSFGLGAFWHALDLARSSGSETEMVPQ